MPRLTRRHQPAEPKPVPPLVPCEQCGRKVRAGADGTTGPHQRPTVPGDDGHSDIVPTFTACTTEDRQSGTGED